MDETQNAENNVKYKIFSWCRRNGFLLLLLTSTLIGYVLGISLQSLNLSIEILELIEVPGNLVLRAFLMILVPLIFCALVLGISNIKQGSDTRMVTVTIGFFLSLSIVSAIMGVLAGHLVHPGQKISTEISSENERMSGNKGLILDSVLDLLRNAVPSNIVESTFTKEYTHREIVKDSDALTNSSVNYKRIIKQARGINFAGILVFSSVFGSALACLGEKGRNLREVIQQLNDVVMIILGFVIKLLPIGTFFWMFREGLEIRAQDELFRHIGVFMATAFGFMAIHQFVLLPFLYFVIVRKNPFRFHMNLLPAIFAAFGTSSSAATLPVTMKCSEESNRLRTSITRFVLPLGMIVHKNGSCLYGPLLAIFLAQLEGVEIGISETIVMTFTNVMLIIASPATPNANNPVYLMTTMAAGGISSPQFISVFFSIDWLMERFRTFMNVVGDCYVAAFMEKLCKTEIEISE